MNGTAVDGVAPGTAGCGAGLGLGVIEQLALVCASAGAHQVGIVRRWADTDSLGGAAEEVAHVVRELLQGVSRIGTVVGSEDLVEENGIMRRSGGTCHLVSQGAGGLGQEKRRAWTGVKSQNRC